MGVIGVRTIRKMRACGHDARVVNNASWSCHVASSSKAMNYKGKQTYTSTPKGKFQGF